MQAGLHFRSLMPVRESGCLSFSSGGLGRSEIRRNKLLFHIDSGIRHIRRVSAPREMSTLRTAENTIVENDGAASVLLRRVPARGEVMAEIVTQLAPFRTDDAQVIRGETVISKDLAIDSLAVMDMVMELEDRFGVSIPMTPGAQTQTVDELADPILKLAARR